MPVLATTVGDSFFASMASTNPRPILLIDDSHEDLFLCKRLLSRSGVTHPIVTVDGGEEAIVFLRAAILPQSNDLLPFLIFCDVKMPGQNGFDVLGWIRGQRQLDSVPRYILSGAGLETDRARAIELGATDYLVKFPTPDVFQKIIAEAERKIGGG
jgi:CheY-like chemotaxis protein